jgi:hypothetical protein
VQAHRQVLIITLFSLPAPFPSDKQNLFANSASISSAVTQIRERRLHSVPVLAADFRITCLELSDAITSSISWPMRHCLPDGSPATLQIWLLQVTGPCQPERLHAGWPFLPPIRERKRYCALDRAPCSECTKVQLLLGLASCLNTIRMSAPVPRSF